MRLTDGSNPVKEALARGESTLGVFVPMPSPEIVEVVALAGFDFVMLDGEHGRVSPDNAYPMILAAEARGVPALARVGQNDRQVILKFLDLGIQGVMIPQTNTPEEAAAAVAAMRYQPRGVRGLAGGRHFDYGLGAPAPQMVPQLNDRVLAIVQFEHIDALGRLDEILAMPELDVLFVGPNDLAQSLGFPGQPGHPQVEAAIERVCAAAKGGRVALGTVAPDAAATNRRLAQGFRMVVTNVPSLLGGAANGLLAAVERQGATLG
ncbi:MAG: aldolase/citrate lyase family protein [Chloroflexota bacterium]|nr:aldolase/citrate lyase family protein [Chloroflexota bacterium]